MCVCMYVCVPTSLLSRQMDPDKILVVAPFGNNNKLKTHPQRMANLKKSDFKLITI